MKRTQVVTFVVVALVVAATVAQATFLRTVSPLAIGNGRSYVPILHQDSRGMLYVAWTDARRDKFDLYLVRSKDGGRTWSDEFRIDAGKAPEVESAGLALAEGKGAALHAVWFATHAEKDVRVMLAVSRDQGTTWSLPRQLNASPGVGYEPQIAGDGAGHLYVTWYELRPSSEAQKSDFKIKVPAPQMFDVYFTASDDDGASWRAPVRLNPRETPSMALRPQIAYGGEGYVYVLWQESEPGQPLGVHFAVSPDHGKTWPVRGMKIDRGNRGTTTPRLVADRSGHVYAAWNDSREVTFAVYFNASADHGYTWLSQDIRLGRTPPSKHHALPPRVAVTPAGRVFVTWMDTRNHVAAPGADVFSRNDVFFTASEDYGKTWWTRDVRLNTVASGSSRAVGQQIVSDREGRRVAVAWSDARTGREAVYLTYSTNGGRTWLKTEIPVDKDATSAQKGLDPVLLMGADGALLVAWEVGRTGRDERRGLGRPPRDIRARRIEIRAP
jgi:Neuraminidase (sialidase)